MRSPLINKYTHSHLGELVIMLSLDGVQSLLPHVGLTLQTPIALQTVCKAVTDTCPEAEYDEDAMGWNRWYGRIAQTMRDQSLSELGDEDRNRFMFWLENGTPPDAHTFPHRSFWLKAMAWAANSDAISDLVDGAKLNLIKDFALNTKEARLDPEYEAAKAKLANEPETFADTFQKAKFHINIVPDAIVSQHLIMLNRMRAGHILRTQTERFIIEGGDVSVLEDAVRLYADTQVRSKWLKDYVADRGAFAYATLWSNTYREQSQ